MKIRKAEIGDETSLANIILTTWKDAYRGIVSDEHLDNLSFDRYKDIFKKNLSENIEVIFVLEDEQGNVTGFASGKKHDGHYYDCELVGIYIIPQYQKKGYGKKLFQAVVREHYSKGYKSMLIWTFDKNRDKEFYYKLGGVPKADKLITIGGRDIPTIGFVWDDINKVLGFIR